MSEEMHQWQPPWICRSGSDKPKHHIKTMAVCWCQTGKGAKEVSVEKYSANIKYNKMKAIDALNQLLNVLIIHGTQLSIKTEEAALLHQGTFYF